MALWFNQNIQLDELNRLGKNTLGEYIGIRFSEVGEDYLRAIMPVDHRTHQPYGLLHGGASVALAETVGSVASALVIDQAKFMCVGLEINANHIRSARNGTVEATCKPIHIGGTTHVWDIQIRNEQQTLICVSRLTVAILKKKGV